MIHNCDKCNKPILIYGRMIPCKHVFCYKCAQAERTLCPRCKDKVSRVEQAGLGSIYTCSHGGSRYGSNGCRRTYLSQRDLQAHIHHRHVKHQAASSNSTSATTTATSLPPQGVPSAAAIAAATAAIVADRKKTEAMSYETRGTTNPANFPAAAAHYSQPPPSSSHLGIMRSSSQQSSNLITVPIQDHSEWTSSQQQQSAYTQPPPNYYSEPNSGGLSYQYQGAANPAATANSSYDSNGQWPTSGRTSTSQMGSYYRR